MSCDGQPKPRVVDPDERREQLRSTALQDQLNAMVKRLNKLEEFKNIAQKALLTSWNDKDGNFCIRPDEFWYLDCALWEVMNS